MTRFGDCYHPRCPCCAWDPLRPKSEEEVLHDAGEFLKNVVDRLRVGESLKVERTDDPFRQLVVTCPIDLYARCGRTGRPW